MLDNQSFLSTFNKDLKFLLMMDLLNDHWQKEALLIDGQLGADAISNLLSFGEKDILK